MDWPQNVPSSGVLSFDPVSITFSDSPYDASFGEIISASAGVSNPTVIQLPPAVGSGQPIIVVKVDGNNFSIVVTPDGTDTINDVNAVDDIIIQYSDFWYVDSANGAWIKI